MKDLPLLKVIVRNFINFYDHGQRHSGSSFIKKRV